MLLGKNAKTSGLGIVFLCLVVFVCNGFAADVRFPFVVPGLDSCKSATDMSYLSDGPSSDFGFVRVKDGHFYNDAGRLRIWGANICIDGNFPDKKDAPKIAAHLRKIGLNGVRFHHVDWYPSPRGIWAKELVDGKRVFDPVQQDKLEYFMYELRKYGIYFDLNLHVTRTFLEEEGFVTEGLPPIAATNNKWILYFEPRMRELLKEYCKDYLTHVNPYTKLRLVDDPAVAVVEITNENIFSRDPSHAYKLPEPYMGEFKRQWNVWLKKKYGSTKGLEKVYLADSEPLGEVVTGDAKFTDGIGAWAASGKAKFEPVAAVAGPDENTKAVKLDIIEKADKEYEQEFTHYNLKIEKGKLYTVSFWAKADKGRNIYVDISNNGPENWNTLGFKGTFKLEPKWKLYQNIFKATGNNDGKARFCFKVGGSDADIYLADMKVQRGGVVCALPEGQSIEKANIELPAEGCNRLAKKDLKQFMVDTETEFVVDMKNYLVNELGVKVPITASQYDYHDETVVPKTCDYADVHIYWQHPEFPNISWDKEDWILPTKPMEWFVLNNPLLNGACAKRVEGMPYTMSEWNIPNPSVYAASLATFPAMVAAMQDWDAIYFFEYHSLPGQWDVDHITEFFELNGNPVKVAMFTSCANMFRRADIKPLKKKALGTLYDRMPGSMAFTYQIGVDPKADKADEKIHTKEKLLKSEDGNFVWDARDKDTAYVKACSDASRAVWGFIANQSFDLAGIEIHVGQVERDYGAVVLTSLDGEKLEDSKRILLTTAGAADNLNMGWNEAHNSVGTRWGHGPSHITIVPATITIDSDVKKIYALDGRGKRKKSIPIINIEGKTTFKTSAAFKTLWYEIVSK